MGVAVCGYNDAALCPAAWADKYRGPDGGLSEAAQPNATAAHKLEGHLLLVSGDLDENVHVSHTLAVVAALGPSAFHTLIGVGLIWWPFYSRIMRGDGPFIFAQVKHGEGVDAIAEHVLNAWRKRTHNPV